jgi:dienelactone hydrolase
MATVTPSPACCRTAPPEAPSYAAEGTYATFNGLHTYVTGAANPTQAILLIYDIFGMYPQTIRGADILAASIAEKSGQPTKVFVPDWFDEPADINMYPPDTDEKMKYILDFFGGPASADVVVPKIDGLLKEMEGENKGIKSWGIMGHCWGGKVRFSYPPAFGIMFTDRTIGCRLQHCSPNKA